MKRESISALMRTRWWHLPTLWSGCLAAAWLGGYWPGVERRDGLVLLLLGASVVFMAAMFLGGASEPSADPSRGRLAGGLGAGLLAGGGRWLLYPLASAVSSRAAWTTATGEGFLLALYVVGLGLLGRGGRAPRWPWVLLVLPVVANAVLSARFGPGHLVVVALPVFWLGRVAFGRQAPLCLGRVAALRAGIVLVDLSAVAACTPFLPWLGWFAILFVLALACERSAPAK